jgi:hypothetical protein
MPVKGTAAPSLVTLNDLVGSFSSRMVPYLRIFTASEPVLHGGGKLQVLDGADGTRRPRKFDGDTVEPLEGTSENAASKAESDRGEEEHVVGRQARTELRRS